MGFKVRLEWFDKTTDLLSGTEHSPDLGDDHSVISKLGLSEDEDVNNGMFELRLQWLSLLQTYFSHKIALSESDYFIALDYEDAYE